MTTVVADISVSLDGFVTGPDAGPDNGLGTGGEPLHTWVLDSDDPLDAEVLARSTERAGAVVMGRNLFDVIDAPSGWNDEMGFGAQHATRPPFVVVTHEPPADVRLELDFRFVTDLPTAIEQAKAVAGDKDVIVMGGGEIIRQSVDAGLVDELVLHLSPVVLGAGTPLFVDAIRRELVQRVVRPSRTAVHLTYDVR
ncbi:MAG: DNA-binding protein [Frankiales bacterium]|nr:DNA-binding protein [Frankiales bacterium]